MKKFFKFLIVFIVIIGGFGAYAFLANGKMMWHVVKVDCAEISADLNKAFSKTQAYGNYDITWNYELKDSDGNMSYCTANILVKYDNENRYLSIDSVSKDADGNETKSQCVVEDVSGECRYYMNKNIGKESETKNKTLVVSDTAWKDVFGYILPEDYSATGLSVILEKNETLFNEAIIKNTLKKATVAFSFKPFYAGAKYINEIALSKSSIFVGMKGNVRKYEASLTTEVSEGKTENKTISYVINKPGKSVTPYILTDEQKALYV